VGKGCPRSLDLISRSPKAFKPPHMNGSSTSFSILRRIFAVERAQMSGFGLSDISNHPIIHLLGGVPHKKVAHSSVTQHL
jgi:hypothetical protein